MMKLPLEKKYEIAVGTVHNLFRLLGIFGKKLQEKLGDRGIEFIRGVMEESGKEAGRAVKPLLPGEDAGSVGGFLLATLNAMGLEYEVKEISDKRVCFTVSSCPAGVDNFELCQALMSQDEALVRTLGTTLRLRYPQTVAKGDSGCEIIIEQQ